MSIKKNNLISLILAVFFIVAGAFILAAQADIQYPVAELGNCQDEASCGEYCDDPENITDCLDFAKANNLMSEEDIAMAEKFAAAGSVGPGGCTGKDSCETYCNDISHINECIAFAEKNDLMPPEELAEAKKVQAALSRGVKPPAGCNSKASCDSYCEKPENMEECIAFAEEAGFLEGKELEDAQKMLQAVKRGVKPPPCQGKDACEEYCSSPDNMEVCMNFAIEAGFMSEEEKEGAQKMLEALKKGVKPLPCRGREDCDSYCGQDAHIEECMNFAVAAGFMSEEDAVMARKTGGKGPGDCRGKEECENFCDNPDNQETCFNFATEHGLIPEEDLRQMEEGKQQMQEALNQAPAEVIDCISSQIGPDLVEKLRNGTGMPSREIGDTMQSCFQEVGIGPGMGPSSDTMMQGGGPGGCQTPEECQAYCAANPQECGAPPQGSGEGMPPGDFQQFQQPEGQEFQRQEFEGQMPEGMMPEGMMPEGISPEQFQQQYQEQYQEQFQEQMQQQMEQQIQQQMQQEFQEQMQQQIQQMPPEESMMPEGEQFSPPPSTEQPQSFLDQAQNFLGSIIISIFGVGR